MIRRSTAVTVTSTSSLARLGRSRHPFAPLLARLWSHGIDQRLADGVAPWQGPVYAARARQLAGDRQRRSLARSLERLVEEAEQPMKLSLWVVIHPSRARVREARPLMLMLAWHLRADASVAPRGLAALHDLLTDGAGPIYTYGDPLALKRRLEEIAQQLGLSDGDAPRPT